MKYKKDLPRKYRDYVLWVVVPPGCDTRCGGATYDSKEWADASLLRVQREQGYTVQPILCLPLTMLGHDGCYRDRIIVRD